MVSVKDLDIVFTGFSMVIISVTGIKNLFFLRFLPSLSNLEGVFEK